MNPSDLPPGSSADLPPGVARTRRDTPRSPRAPRQERATPGGDGTATGLTHVDAHGAAHMVDVSGKKSTARTAVATGVVRTTAEVIGLLHDNALAKGDALATARIAGIMAAKRTPDLIPLCHPIAISQVSVDFSVSQSEIEITTTVSTTDRTGVEMEALTAVTVAGLTVHDMIKAVDPAAVLDAVQVQRKDGGKTGTWVRPEGR